MGKPAFGGDFNPSRTLFVFEYCKTTARTKGGGSSAFLKGIYYNKDLSERALRYKIREFEEEGLIEIETHSDDKRTKKILATPELLNKLNAHSHEFSRMLSSEFLIFPKK